VKLYIWEGRGISSAYHDDGTLVVLAESPEHARQVVKNAERAYRAAIRRAGPTIKAIRAEMQALVDANGGRWSSRLWQTPEGKALADRQAAATPVDPGIPDGSMDRDPDRVVEITKPALVAFNGGRYD